MMAQKATIKKEIFFSGLGVHSGQNVECLLKPSSSGDILFSVKNEKSYKMHIDPSCIESGFCSILSQGPQKIYTIEHLLSALYVYGVDSIEIELRGNEVPILDGSALPIARALEEAEIQTLPAKKPCLKVIKPFVVREGEASVSVEPDEEFKVSYTIEFDHPAIQTQSFDLVVSIESYLSDIAPARTFGFLKDVEKLRAQGLALGGSFENALVLDEKSVINGPLRYADEFVRHKIIDLIGDLSLVGYPFVGHVSAHKAGHSIHHKAVHFLLENPDCYTLL